MYEYIELFIKNWIYGLNAIVIIGFIFLLTLDSDFNLWFYRWFGRRVTCLKGKVVWITGASSKIILNYPFIT